MLGVWINLIFRIYIGSTVNAVNLDLHITVQSAHDITGVCLGTIRYCTCQTFVSCTIHTLSALSPHLGENLFPYPLSSHLTDLQLVKAAEQVKEGDVHLSIFVFCLTDSVSTFSRPPHFFQSFPSASSLWFSRQSWRRKPSLGPISLFWRTMARAVWTFMFWRSIK